jgi:hypothetical protein
MTAIILEAFAAEALLYAIAYLLGRSIVRSFTAFEGELLTRECQMQVLQNELAQQPVYPKDWYAGA